MELLCIGFGRDDRVSLGLLSLDGRADSGDAAVGRALSRYGAAAKFAGDVQYALSHEISILVVTNVFICPFLSQQTRLFVLLLWSDCFLVTECLLFCYDKRRV